jgi:hypothetical protein
VPINSVPVDQNVFTRLMLVAIEPKTDRETGAQITSNDGLQRKWTVQVVASMPSRFDPTRTESEVLQVTLTSAEDPTGKVAEGDQVEFDGLTAGVMPPEQSESGRIRGGKLFWSCFGVHSRNGSGKNRGGAEV